jgi:hypothetical protein
MAVAATAVLGFTVTIPAGTPQSNPFTQDCSFPVASVVSIRWRVPPGPSGYMGFQVTSDGAPVIPMQQGAYIVADDEFDEIPLQGFQDSGSWQVTGYNNDTYDHSVYLRFSTVPAGQDVPGTPASSATVPAVTDASLSPPAPAASTFTAGVQVQR